MRQENNEGCHPFFNRLITFFRSMLKNVEHVKIFSPTYGVQLDADDSKSMVNKLTNDVKHVEIGANRWELFLFT